MLLKLVVFATVGIVATSANSLPSNTDITSVNTLPELLEIAKNEVPKAEKSFEDIQTTLRAALEKISQGGEAFLKQVTSGPEKCRGMAESIQQHVETNKEFINTQAKRDIVGEMKAIPKIKAVLETFLKTVQTIQEGIEAGKSSDFGTASNIKAQMITARNDLSFGVRDFEKTLLGQILKNDQLLKLTVEYYKCAVQNSVRVA